MRFTLYCSDLKNVTNMMQVCKGSSFEPWDISDVFHRLSGKEEKGLKILLNFLLCSCLCALHVSILWGVCAFPF
jgi:hypothetical protein